jgi:VanZ family protein
MRRYPFTLVCIALILILCFCHPSAIPVKMPSVIGLDKIAHFIMYLGTCSVIWTEYLLRHSTINYRRTFLFAIIAPIALSGAIEITQGAMTDFRGADIYDFYANAAGALTALLVPYGWWLSHKIQGGSKNEN